MCVITGVGGWGKTAADTRWLCQGLQDDTAAVHRKQAHRWHPRPSRFHFRCFTLLFRCNQADFVVRRRPLQRLATACARQVTAVLLLTFHKQHTHVILARLHADLVNMTISSIALTFAFPKLRYSDGFSG